MMLRNKWMPSLKAVWGCVVSVGLAGCVGAAYEIAPQPLTDNTTSAVVEPKSTEPADPYVGIASYYGGKFHGRRTANGEIFNKNAYTAAHKTLPFGGYWLVTNLRNGKQVIVRINDRGPYIKGRIIDLSKQSAKQIGMLHSGIDKVRIKPIQVDKRGYITDENAQALYQLAQKQKLPLKLKAKQTTKKQAPPKKTK